MPNLYINNILICPEVITQLDVTALIAQYDYAQQTGVDEYLTFSVDGYTPDVVVQTYLINAGTLSNAKHKIATDIMTQLLVTHPAYVLLHPHDEKNKHAAFIMTRDQLRTYIKHMTPTSIKLHYKTIIESILKLDDIEYILEYTSRSYAIINCSKEFYPFVPYIDKMYYDAIWEDIDVPECTHIDGDKLMFKIKIHKCPSGMIHIKSNNEFCSHLKYDNIHNLYINGDVVTPVLQLNTINKLTPDVFATWRIGPLCRRMRNIFKYYPYMPHIQKWDLSNVLDITGMFAHSAVTDLSMLYFSKCKRASYAFNGSKICKSPRFDSIKICDNMFCDCAHLEDVTLINTKYLEHVSDMFQNCILLQSAFNNCVFEHFKKGRDMFQNCIALQSALNNCTFPEHEISLLCTFDNCPLLHDVLNNCEYIQEGHSIIWGMHSVKEIVGTKFYLDGCAATVGDGIKVERTCCRYKRPEYQI